MNFIEVAQFQNLGLVVVAMILGALIGWEREWAHKPAGLRTHMLVSGAAALLVTLGEVIVLQQDPASPNLVRTDPIRILEAIITGVSFLGAGTIIYHRSEESIEGLTTAASILLAAAVGVGVALGQFILAGGVTILVLLTFRGLSIVERGKRS
jgi:putative Mg2+ transporter-C (MgtC) family protein